MNKKSTVHAKSPPKKSLRRATPKKLPKKSDKYLLKKYGCTQCRIILHDYLSNSISEEDTLKESRHSSRDFLSSRVSTTPQGVQLSTSDDSLSQELDETSQNCQFSSDCENYLPSSSELFICAQKNSEKSGKGILKESGCSPFDIQNSYKIVEKTQCRSISEEFPDKSDKYLFKKYGCTQCSIILHDYLSSSISGEDTLRESGYSSYDVLSPTIQTTPQGVQLSTFDNSLSQELDETSQSSSDSENYLSSSSDSENYLSSSSELFISSKELSKKSDKDLLKKYNISECYVLLPKLRNFLIRKWIPKRKINSIHYSRNYLAHVAIMGYRNALLNGKVTVNFEELYKKYFIKPSFIDMNTRLDLEKFTEIAQRNIEFHQSRIDFRNRIYQLIREKEIEIRQKSSGLDFRHLIRPKSGPDFRRRLSNLSNLIHEKEKKICRSIPQEVIATDDISTQVSAVIRPRQSGEAQGFTEVNEAESSVEPPMETALQSNTVSMKMPDDQENTTEHVINNTVENVMALNDKKASAKVPYSVESTGEVIEQAAPNIIDSNWVNCVESIVTKDTVEAMKMSDVQLTVEARAESIDIKDTEETQMESNDKESNTDALDVPEESLPVSESTSDTEITEEFLEMHNEMDATTEEEDNADTSDVPNVLSSMSNDTFHTIISDNANNSTNCVNNAKDKTLNGDRFLSKSDNISDPQANHNCLNNVLPNGLDSAETRLDGDAEMCSFVSNESASVIKQVIQSR